MGMDMDVLVVGLNLFFPLFYPPPPFPLSFFANDRHMIGRCPFAQ